MHVPRRCEGGAALAATPAPVTAPHPNTKTYGGGAGVTLIKKEGEEETLGQLRDRVALASTRASAPGPRAVFVHIKVEDTDGEGAGGGDGEDATGGEGDGEGEEQETDEVQEEEEEEEKAEEVEDEEEADEGLQREQNTQVPSVSLEGIKETGADAVSPPRRARPLPGSYADTAVDCDEEEEVEDEDEDEWGSDEEEEEEEEEVEEEVGPRYPRAHESGASLKGGSEAVRIQRLTAGARSEPGSPRARLRTPGRIADIAVQDNSVREQQQKQQEEEEAEFVPELVMRGAGDRAGTSQLLGVSWQKRTNTWQAEYKGKYLGYHTTEDAAARAYSKYLEDGSLPEPADCTSQFRGVSWSKSQNKWTAECNGTHLGRHATEEEAARARSKYLEDHIDPVNHREAGTSRFTGVSWDKNRKRWRARCKGKALGYHTTEQAAAQAYNFEAERISLPLNITPPVRAAGTATSVGPNAGGGVGTQRAASKPPAIPTTDKRPALTSPAAPAPTKKVKL